MVNIVRSQRQSGAGSSKGSSTDGSVWLRINAFLSLKAPETVRTYTGIVSEWCRFLGHEPGTDGAARAILQAEDLHAAAYRAWLAERPGEAPRRSQSSVEKQVASSSRDISKDHQKKRQKKTGLESTQSNATVHKKFAALRRIYRVLVAHNLALHGNPFDTDRTPPPAKESGRKRPTEMISFDLVMAIVNAPDLSTPKGVRDRAILALLFGGALRRSELTQLRIGDVRTSSNGTTFLYLRSTKAKVDAQQALPKWSVNLLKAQIEQRMAEGGTEHDFLFVGYTGQGGKVPSSTAISDVGVYQLFKGYCMAVGAGPHVTPHSARATAITKLLADGIPHREVQAFSRHASIQMVEHYDKRRFDVEKSPAKTLSFEDDK